MGPQARYDEGRSPTRLGTASKGVKRGNDTINGGVGLAALVKLTLDGGDGADTLLGGDGNDTIDGNGGNDTIFLGNGNDTAVWDPGDGSDTVEGGAGQDTQHFNGSAGAEIFAASANGNRLSLTRNVGNVIMDVDDVEQLDLNALGGADTVTVNDLTGTDVTTVNINLGVNGSRCGRRCRHRQRHRRGGRNPNECGQRRRSGHGAARSGEHQPK